MTSEFEDAMETLNEARASIGIFYQNSSRLYRAVESEEEISARDLKSLNMKTGTAWAESSQDYLDLSGAYDDGLYVKKALVDATTDVMTDILDDSPETPDLGDDPSAKEIFRGIEQDVFQILNQYHAAEYQTLLASRNVDIEPTAADVAYGQTQDEELQEAIEFNLNEAEREHIRGHLEKVNEELDKDPSETYHLFIPAGDTT